MISYNDYHREQIAKQEYEPYITGKKVKIDDGYGGKITVGYVSEIKDSFSGLQVYVVTDIKLPEQPTAADYEKVTHVTLLYRGSTGFNEIVDKPVDVLADWVVNDIPMAIRTTVPDTIPTRASVQLRKAADFTNDSLEKYPNALFDFYGHSLGSMNAQYALTSIDEKNLDRVSGAFIYNGPNTYRVLNEEQRQKVDYLHSLIYNYVDPKDLIGMGYSQPDGAVGQVFV